MGRRSLFGAQHAAAELVQLLHKFPRAEAVKTFLMYSVLQMLPLLPRCREWFQV